MNLVKGIKSVTDKVDVSNEQYTHIETWKQLYRGYHPLYHTIKYVTPEGPKERVMHSLKMPKQVAQKMATLIYNEKCEVNISDEGYHEFMRQLLKANKFDSVFQTQLEYGFALGGLVAKGYIEDSRVRLNYVTADCFVPVTYDVQGSIREAVFVNETHSAQKKYTLLEWHLWRPEGYLIKNELYESDNREELGVKVPLNRLQQYADLDEETYVEGLDRPLFAYFKPNLANNFDFGSPLGISLFANAIDTLKDLDAAYDSFKQEFKLGRKRIMVPAYALKAVVDPETGKMKRYYDATDEVYEALNLDDGEQFKDISMPLRVDEHISAINAYLKILAMQLGMSPGTFTFDESGLKTATEVVSQNDETFRTKQAHETMVEAFITEIVEILGVLSLANGDIQAIPEYELTVAFDDSIAEDSTAIANRQIMLVGAGLQSKVRAIMKVQKVSEEEAQLILSEVNQEQSAVMSAQVDMMGIGLGVTEDVDTV